MGFSEKWKFRFPCSIIAKRHKIVTAENFKKRKKRENKKGKRGTLLSVGPCVTVEIADP